MRLRTLLFIAGKVLNYRFARLGLTRPRNPLNFTFSVTNRCQSRCLSCNIWELYRKEPDKLREELTLPEIEKLFQSVGPVYFFNISGGCPFLRPDLPQIAELACKYLQPAVIHIPTNALAVDKTRVAVESILRIMPRYNPDMILQIKPSFDGVGGLHDEVRGVKGNFAKLLRLIHDLKNLQKTYPRLHVGLGTVISRFNVTRLREIIACADSFNVDSYISEIAENRAEMFNTEEAIAPSPADYKKALAEFKAHVQARLRAKKGLTRITDAFRLVYYDLAEAIVEKQTQVIPCLGGISNAHVDPYGSVWPCCVLGDTQALGNLRAAGFDFQAIWNSAQAQTVRRFIRGKKCHCPLANQSYANILCNIPAMLRVMRHLLPFTANGARDTN